MDTLSLIGFGGACAAAATTGAMYPPGPWYEALDKPGWTPPNWLFPLAWTALYIAITYAAWRVSATDPALAMPALAFWACQMVLNALWTPIFFGKKMLGAALLALGFLWGAVAITLILFWRADMTAGLLFVPYLIWVSYAGALNYAIWRRNPDAGVPDLA